MKRNEWEPELLDWVTACQSAYHIENTPGHRFGNLPGVLEANRADLVEYVRELISSAGTKTNAARDVLAERRRQIEAEGWTPEHDDEHSVGELAKAAACYALVSAGFNPDATITVWPWHRLWWKPSDKRRNLVKAGALILAEIERLDRMAERQEGV
jgi:hypothetical protein